MNFDFHGITVLLTGAASGIGKALALGFLQAGANVIASDYNWEGLHALQREVEEYEKRIVIRKCDVSREEEVTRLFEDHSFGNGMDVLVHCAGITYTKSLTETTREEYRKLIETNMTGTFNCMQAAVNSMRSANRGGSIINISSINAQWPLPTQAVYTATKAAIESMSQCLAVEAAKWNIRVNCIAPGAIDTPMNKGLHGERRKSLSQRIPLGRVGLSSDMVGAALFLASPLSNYITGSTITIDGGLIVSR